MKQIRIVYAKNIVLSATHSLNSVLSN